MKTVRNQIDTYDMNMIGYELVYSNRYVNFMHDYAEIYLISIKFKIQYIMILCDIVDAIKDTLILEES